MKEVTEADLKDLGFVIAGVLTYGNYEHNPHRIYFYVETQRLLIDEVVFNSCDSLNKLTAILNSL